MLVNYSNQLHIPDPNSIFLAGPTSRLAGVYLWRERALSILESLKFNGTVYVPQYEGFRAISDYLPQVEWEYKGLEACGLVAFWVPREMNLMPGLTTNIEFGRYVGKKPVVYGRPEDAQHVRYLDWLYSKIVGDQICNTLEDTMKLAVQRLGANE